MVILSTSSRQNAQSKARRRAGRRLAEAIADLNVNIGEIAKDTGVDRVTLDNLHSFTPHLSTIERVSRYLEDIAKEKYQERKLQKVKIQRDRALERHQAILQRQQHSLGFA